MKNKELPHGAVEGGVDRVFLAWHGKAHTQEIRRVLQLIPWIDEWLADRIFVSHGGNGRHFRDHADTGHLPLRRILDIDRVVIKRRERSSHANHDRHWMRVAAKPGIEPDQLLMHHGVLDDAVFKRFVLFGRRQLCVEQEETCLKKGAVLSKLFDRITAIEYDPLVEVDERDL